MKRTDLIEHPSLICLMPFLQSYVKKGLQEINSVEKRFSVSQKEIYSARVCERVAELDNSIKSLRIALNFVGELNNSANGAHEIYRYHYENFILRLTGIVDRSHRLVGTSIFLDEPKLEEIGANKYVSQKTKTEHPEIHGKLQEISASASCHRGLRNQIAHSGSFSTRELVLLSAAYTLSIDFAEQNQLDELLDLHSSEGYAELATLLASMVEGVEGLLNELDLIYQSVANA